MKQKPTMAYIYTIRNIINCKNYVGSADDDNARFVEHKINLNKKRHLNRHLQSAWKKYGAEAFILIRLEVCAHKERYKREQWWMDHLKASDAKYGYNIVHAVKSLVPAKRRSKISKEIWQRPGLKERVGKWAASQWLKPGYKEKMTAVSVEQWQDEGRMSRHKARLAKRWSDPKERKALTKRNLARWNDESERKKYANKISALWATNEYREKQIKVMQDRWKDPGYVAKIKAARKATAADPAYIAKLSAKRKEYWAKRREEQTRNS